MKRFKVTNNELVLLKPFPKLWKKKALQLSIKKWEAIADYLEENKQVGTINSNGVVTCALCQLYIDKTRCGECPIKEDTGKDGCFGTPQSHEPTLSNARLELHYLRNLYNKLYD